MLQMKTPAQLQESIERFKKCLWDRAIADRPPVAIAPKDIWLPIKYLRKPFAKSDVVPDDLRSSPAMTDYEFAFAKKAVTCDDFIPFCAPWRAIPWLEAISGCTVRYSIGSLAPVPFAKSAADLCDVPIPAKNDWLQCMIKQLAVLGSNLPADCWLSPTILRGPSDVLAAMRGLSDFCCDLIDNPAEIDQAAARINRLLLDCLDEHFSHVKPKLAGYGNIFGYWAPQKTIVIQEDVLGLCSPARYRDIFQKYNAEIVNRLGGCVFFHLHSTGYAHYKNVLALTGLAGVQITVEANGPSLLDMLPDLQTIIEKSRLILYAEHFFEQLPQVLRKLPKTGLYLILPDTFIKTDDQFTKFVKILWRQDS